MTLEEKAEKYARKTKKVDWEGFDVDKEARKEAYIAGATENDIVWHDLRKNPNDLPDNTDSVLSDKGVIVYYNFTHACWVDERASVKTDDVIAWCEVPQYTEE